MYFEISGQAPDETFDGYLKAGEFRIQRCTACERHVFNPRVLCPHCGSTDLTWIAVSGKGTVYSTTVVRRKADRGGDYNVAIVELEEGPRMMSRVEEAAPSEVWIGMQVIASIVQEDGKAIVVFNPEKGSGT